MIQVDALALPGIRHGFFGRRGGYSSGVFSSLNCGLGSGDDKADVVRNRARVAGHLGCEASQLVTAYQVHSAEAMIVETPFPADERPQLDGLVTAQSGIVLGALTADCCPILLADPQARVVGAAHAGWKGALHGVAEATICRMEELGARRADIAAVLGPTISQASYEVGAEFRAAFPERAWGYFINSSRNGHYMFDLTGYLKERLQSFGVGLVAVSGLCTYAEEEDYFSYRRSTHRQERDYGRQISAICLV